MMAVELTRATWWPWLLVVPVVFAALGLLSRVRARRVQRAVGARTAAVTADVPVRRRRLRHVLFALGALFALLAVLEPRAGHARSVDSWQGVDVIVCLDVSRSMRATDLAPDRLGHAKASLRALAAHAQGDRLALVAFAGEARLVAPLTKDRDAVVALSEQLDPSAVLRGGTDLGAALRVALRAAQGRGTRPAAIVLLTDGEDHRGQGARVARRARAQEVPVHCVGLGTALGSKIPLEADGGRGFLRDRNGAEVISKLAPASLRSLAEASGGAYVPVSSGEPLVDLYDEHLLPRARIANAAMPGAGTASRFQWPLLLALVFWLAELALSDRRRR